MDTPAVAPRPRRVRGCFGGTGCSGFREGSIPADGEKGEWRVGIEGPNCSYADDQVAT
jgi:hypothetical protein